MRSDDQASIDAVNDALQKMYDDGSFDRFVIEHLNIDPDELRATPGDTSFLAAE
ncbi:hypothetical protein [uncultured Corynebacterium sp.]|uniref:hypothetical protein n=1 Tax=uncultured Corynebacterium sp. TaxID=159447 RepID=UPI002630638D|nr:hypothetical protein [uncultured Corynebacterium sp.]